MTNARRLAIALLPLVFLWPAARDTVESRMLLHMLLQFPLLLASGWAASRWLALKRFDAMDAHGLLGLTIVACVAAWWMIPAALDLSLLSTPMRMVKYASWWLTGALLARSWPRLSDELVAFFAGNLAWMLATAGLLLQDESERLCVSYLLGDQAATGRALVLLSLLLAALALRRFMRRELRASVRLP